MFVCFSTRFLTVKYFPYFVLSFLDEIKGLAFTAMTMSVAKLRTINRKPVYLTKAIKTHLYKEPILKISPKELLSCVLGWLLGLEDSFIMQSVAKTASLLIKSRLCKFFPKTFKFFFVAGWLFHVSHKFEK